MSCECVSIRKDFTICKQNSCIEFGIKIKKSLSSEVFDRFVEGMCEQCFIKNLCENTLAKGIFYNGKLVQIRTIPKKPKSIEEKINAVEKRIFLIKERIKEKGTIWESTLDQLKGERQKLGKVMHLIEQSQNSRMYKVMQRERLERENEKKIKEKEDELEWAELSGCIDKELEGFRSEMAPSSKKERKCGNSLPEIDNEADKENDMRLGNLPRLRNANLQGRKSDDLFKNYISRIPTLI